MCYLNISKDSELFAGYSGHFSWKKVFNTTAENVNRLYQIKRQMHESGEYQVSINFNYIIMYQFSSITNHGIVTYQL